MKIFSTSDIKDIDKYTIENEPISSEKLMERAASSVACEIISRWRPNKRMVVFAGPGNNGGDALIVARMLIEQGYQVEVFLFNIGGNKLSADCKTMKDRLLKSEKVDFTEVTTIFDPPTLSSKDIVIDGLFGTGLKSPLAGGYAALVRYINESGAYIISIDVPSGLFGEWNSTNNRQYIINANLTLAFQFSRLAFFFSENNEFIGEWKILDIELSQEAIRKTNSEFYLIEKAEAKKLLKKRKKYTNKYDYGSLLLVAGSYGMMGASILASRAAYRTGCGLVGVHAPRCGMTPFQSAVPEAIFEADKNDIVTTNIEPKRKYSTIALGPGIGKHGLTIDALERFLIKADSPCILDADALNCIHERPSILNNIPVMSIITPHAKEFDRLFGDFYTDEMRLQKALEISRFYNIIIILKGHHTMSVFPDGKIFVNNSGNAGMATAGSGDVLTGVIGSLMAQNYQPEVAAILGVFIHGHAGDLAEKEHGSYGVIASDIVDNIGKAIKDIMG